MSERYAHKDRYALERYTYLLEKEVALRSVRQWVLFTSLAVNVLLGCILIGGAV